MIICSMLSSSHCLILYLREGGSVPSVEVVQRLVNPSLPHVSEKLVAADGAPEEMAPGVLQLDVARALLDLPQNSS